MKTLESYLKETRDPKGKSLTLKVGKGFYFLFKKGKKIKKRLIYQK